MTTEEMVQIYGDKYRSLIEDSLSWLDEKEKVWGLSAPIDIASFIADLVGNTEVK